MWTWSDQAHQEYRAGYLLTVFEVKQLAELL